MTPRKLSRRSAIAGAFAALVMPDIKLAALGQGSLFAHCSFTLANGEVFDGPAEITFR